MNRGFRAYVASVARLHAERFSIAAPGNDGSPKDLPTKENIAWQLD